MADEADKLRLADPLPEALQAARRAADLLPRFGGDLILRREVEDGAADLLLLIRLEEARLEEDTVTGSAGKFDHQRAAALFRRAFQDYGVDVVAGNEADVADRLRDRVIVAEIAVGLGEWGRLTSDSPTEKERLNRLADVLDTDPRQLMSRLRCAWTARDSRALKQLAAEAEANLPSASIVYRLGNVLRQSKALAEAERLLWAGQERYPTDFWINGLLAQVIGINEPKPPRTGLGLREPPWPSARTPYGLEMTWEPVWDERVNMKGREQPFPRPSARQPRRR